MICIEKVNKRNNIFMNLKDMGKPISLPDIVKPFSITFLCVIAALFEHSGIFHLI